MVLGFAFALAATPAAAAELGRLTVYSGVGETLRAEIDLLDVGANEAHALTVRLGTREEFWRTGIEPPPFLDALRAAIARGTKGRTFVALASSQPIDEPFMSLLVQLGSPARQSTREYPLLLEERRGREARPAAPPDPAPSEPTLVPAGPTALAAADGRHRVQAGETLATIVGAFKVPGATLEQSLVAFLRANPGAFVHGNMNQLSAGQVLKVPDEAAVRAIPVDEARRVVAEHRGAAPGAQSAADRPPLTRAEAGSDDGAAAGRTAAEAQNRLGALERSIESLHKLAELQSRQIARLQQLGIAIVTPPGPGDAGAAEAGAAPSGADDRYLQRAFARVVGEHWPWIATALVLAFAAWVWMPLKTARLWRKKRRRRERILRRILRGEDRGRRRRRERSGVLSIA